MILLHRLIRDGTTISTWSSEPDECLTICMSVVLVQPGFKAMPFAGGSSLHAACFNVPINVTPQSGGGGGEGGWAT